MTNKPYLMPVQQFAAVAQQWPEQIYLRQPIDRQYHETTWAQAYEKTLRFAAGLRSLDLQPGDKVAIYSENCAEWFLSDFAIAAAGLISVPIYFSAGEQTISYVLEHSQAKAIIVGKLADYSAIEAALPENIISIALPYPTLRCQHQFNELVEQNQPLADVTEPSPDDMFSISYTSGSTGNPKGVVLSFNNIVTGATRMGTFPDRPKRERVISYLPLAHITERAIIEYASLYSEGSTVTFNESLTTFVDDLRSARVTSFISVPRLWMKFQSSVLANMPQKKLNLLLKIPIFSGIVKRKIKDQLGFGECTSFGSGSAPIAASVLKWFESLDIHIGEAWGMTEVSGMGISSFPFRSDKVGTIGKVVEGFQIKLSEAGEILVRGDAVFKEYYRNPLATTESFTEDGFLRTGDRAEVDADGYYKITGRVKEIFKSGKGKYIAPVPIESLLYQNQLIEQVCVMGSGLPQPKAVAVLSKEVSSNMSEDDISTSLATTLEKTNSKLEKHQQLDGILIAKDEWSIDNGLLTPTLKVKRSELEQRYSEKIGGDEMVVWEV